MSFAYTIQESLSGFKRTKLSSVISIVTICISLLLLGIFAILTINASRFIDALRSKVEIEAFLREPLSMAEIDSLGRCIASIDGVESAQFISKEEAARIFKQEFGEDISTVLDFNPLPPSFKISLRPGFKTSSRVQIIHESLTGLGGVESVVYRKALLELIDQRTAAVNNITLGLGILISLSAILLVSNTIRLAIYAKRRLIRTMELVGATSTFIRLPFLIEGLIQGVLGGLVASALLYGVLEHLIRWISAELSAFIHMEAAFYVLVIAGGTVLGLLGSIISVVRFIDTSRWRRG